MSALVLVTLSSSKPDDLSHEVRERHLRALRRAGLVPVAVAGTASQAEVERVLDSCAAVYLPGTDYVPGEVDEAETASRAGAATAGLAWDRWKVRADESVLRAAWRRRLPALGICGGMQAMVILAGGTLRAAVDDGHRSVAGDHEVRLEPGTLAAAAFEGAEAVAANSYHRQVTDRPPTRLRVSGRARDDVVEAVEAPREEHPFWLGLQWHPELLADGRPFAALAEAACPS